MQVNLTLEVIFHAVRLKSTDTDRHNSITHSTLILNNLKNSWKKKITASLHYNSQKTAVCYCF